jgi:hypothetical protein
MRGALMSPKAKAPAKATATAADEWTSGSLRTVKSRIHRAGPTAPHVASSRQARARPRSVPSNNDGTKPQINILRKALKPVRSMMPTALGSQGLTAIPVAHNRDIEMSPADLHMAVAP